MTITSTSTSTSTSIDAVLFDLSGTLLDEGYALHLLRQAATAMSERWGIDGCVALCEVKTALAVVAAEVADRRFYLMRDMVCEALGRVIAAHGKRVTAGELVALDHLIWAAAIPTAVAADGAIETITTLRAAGICTGIVSFADIGVFEGLLEQTGLGGLTDIEVCSETARACKPHPAIFRIALDGIGVSPERAMFVGDSVETDVVGANRVGMRTALLSGREFAIGGGCNDDPITRPDHHIDHLADVLDVLDLQSCVSRRCRGRRSLV